MTPALSHPLATRNFTRVDVGPITLWFSYTDCVAFQTPDAALPYTLQADDLSQTTRKHIASIEQSCPLSDERFMPALQTVIDRYTK